MAAASESKLSVDEINLVRVEYERYHVSLAMNPILAWVLLNNFDDVIIEDSSPVSFEEYRELTEAPSLKELIFGFFKKYDEEASLSLQIPLNHKNIAKALEVFKTLTHEDSKWGC